MRRITKKWLALLVVGAIAVIAAVGGYAYFTSSGSGTGSASVGSSSNVQLSSSPVGTLYPGGADVPVSVSIHNPGSGAAYIGTISGSVADNGACQGSWFAVDPITYNAELGPNGNDSKSTNVRMLDSGTNQDACQGKTMTINWSSN